MLDSALLEKVMQLDVEARREFVRAIEGSLDDVDIPDEILATIDARLARKGPGPDPNAMTLDEFERRVRARRSA